MSANNEVLSLNEVKRSTKYSYEENLRLINNKDIPPYNFQKELIKFGGKRVKIQESKNGEFYNIQTFCSDKTATKGLEKGNNRRGLWYCPPIQIKAFLNHLETLSRKGFIPDRTIAFKQPHQINRDEYKKMNYNEKSSPLWFDFDVKQTNKIVRVYEEEKFLGCKVKEDFEYYEPVKFYVSGEEIAYDDIGEVMGKVLMKILLKKYPSINKNKKSRLHYYIYHDEIRYDNGFWIYFNMNFYHHEKKEIYEHFHSWCRTKLRVEGLKKPEGFWKDLAPLNNSFVAPLIPKQNRAFKIIFKSNDPDFNNKYKAKTLKLYNDTEMENEEHYRLRNDLWKYNKKMETKLFHHMNKLISLGTTEPPEIDEESRDVGSVKTFKNTEFLHRLNRLKTQNPEIEELLRGACEDGLVKESMYQGQKVWNIKVLANKYVCPIHKTTHHRSVGWINIYAGSLGNLANYYCVHNSQKKIYKDKELKNKLTKPKQSKVGVVDAEWNKLYTDYKFAGKVLCLFSLGKIIKSFYPDIKYVEYNTAGNDCYYKWNNKTGIWVGMEDRNKSKIHTLIRSWWSKYAVNGLIALSTEIHKADSGVESKTFIAFKKAIKEQLQGKSKINALLDSFSVESGEDTETDFSLLLDHKRHILPFKNGTIDWGHLDRKGEYHPPTSQFRCIERDDYVSRYIDKNYYGKYNKPKKYPITIGLDTFKSEAEYKTEYRYLWNKLDRLFETTIRNPVMREYTKKYIAYGQTGYTHLKIFMGFIGNLANNGKSSLCGVIQSQLYPFCVRLKEEFFIDPKLHPTYLDDFRRGARVGYLEEMPEKAKIITNRVKEWVGLLNERAKIRLLYNQRMGEFNMMCKLIICSNFDLPLDNNDNGIKDRARFGEYNTRYLKKYEWEARVEQTKNKGIDEPEKYLNSKGFYPEDSLFTQDFKECELMASVFQDYFYSRSVEAVRSKDLEEPEEMRKKREEISSKADLIACFINDSIAQGRFSHQYKKKCDWICKEKFFSLFKRWIHKVNSGNYNGIEIDTTRFNQYVKTYLRSNELYQDFKQEVNGGKTIKVNGVKKTYRNIIYGLKWIHKETHTDEDGTTRGGWNNKESYREKQQKKKQQSWQSVNVETIGFIESEDEEDEPPKPVKKQNVRKVVGEQVNNSAVIEMEESESEYESDESEIVEYETYIDEDGEECLVGYDHLFT